MRDAAIHVVKGSQAYLNLVVTSRQYSFLSKMLGSMFIKVMEEGILNIAIYQELVLEHIASIYIMPLQTCPWKDY